MSQIVPLLPAATVVCTRRDSLGELEVLLLRRNKKLSFASGFWVFPGGKIETEDQVNGVVDEQAAQTAAVREAMEESGLNLINSELFHFKKWTTPLPSNKRFRTWFFICELQDGPTNVIIDDSEIKDYRWIKAKNALTTIKQDQIKVLPPTFLTLVRIMHCQNFGDIKTEFSRSPILDIHPRTGLDKGVFHAMYPGDVGYDDHDIHKIGARHRIKGNFATGSYEFEYHGCDDVFPVSGGYKW